MKHSYLLILALLTVLFSNTAAQSFQCPAATDQPYITTDQGVKIVDDQNSLKAGVRGPTLLEDFILRGKIFHFDHERIPERVVHARGTGAKGYFKATKSMTSLTKAAFLTDTSLITPVFVRFSTVVGGRGATDMARDVRGFATKFYTTEGNFDLVGNNIPVFFIQDAIKFPDLIHAAKPEPHYEFPEGGTAHNNFWDFISLMPEALHMIMWALSDRALPRSYSTMEGFGVHTFKLVNANNDTTFIKWHWKPKLGVHSISFDENQQISGRDSDFHRRDLYNRIENGYYLEWDLAIQIINDSVIANLGYDILDATKFIPEEVIPLTIIGHLVLNETVTNFFAETEQVAFCTQNIVPGIDFSDDPLLMGRHFSYLDTQLSRLGSPNFMELPVNRPRNTKPNNFEQDGHMQYNVPAGNVNYEPNSLGFGCPYQALGNVGFTTSPDNSDVSGTKIRARAPSFLADHYGQANLFWNSMTTTEQQRIIDAAKFELGNINNTATKMRMIDHFNNINHTFAASVAPAIGVPIPAMLSTNLTKYAPSPSLSIVTGPYSKFNSTTGMKVAVLVNNGVDNTELSTVTSSLKTSQVFVTVISPEGMYSTNANVTMPAGATFYTSDSAVYDGVILLTRFGNGKFTGYINHFLDQAYKHYKTIGASKNAVGALTDAKIPLNSIGVKTEQGYNTTTAWMTDYVTQLSQYRHWTRQADSIDGTPFREEDV